MKQSTRRRLVKLIIDIATTQNFLHFQKSLTLHMWDIKPIDQRSTHWKITAERPS